MKRIIGGWLKVLVFGLCVAFMPVDMANAKVGSTTLESISRAADVIAVAQVEQIRIIGSGNQGKRVAVAKVLHSLKGVKAGQKVAFLAQPTWACDLSRAVAGETVMLFLSKPDEDSLKVRLPKYEEFKAGLKQYLPETPFFQIAYEGGGRINVLQQDKIDYLVVAADRELGKPNARIFGGYIGRWPEGLPVLPHPDAKETYLRLVPLAEVEAAIVAMMQAKKIAEPELNLSEKK